MARFNRFYGETVSMTTTAAHLAAPQGYTEIKHYSASAHRLGLAPSLEKVFYYLASGTSYTDYTDNARDKSTGTHVPLDGMVATDYLYMGFSEMPRGAHFTIDATNKNDNAATLDVEYWNGTAWTDVAGDSDGTDVGPGDTLKQSGLYAWTLPSSVEYTVNGVSGLHWIRFTPSATLSATVDVHFITPACIDTNYGYFEAGQEYEYRFDTGKVGAIETDMAAGSATLNVTWGKT